MKSDVHKQIFTEALDYSKTPKQSIWGNGDPETMEILKELSLQKVFTGKWLHFAAGDGRYNNFLLDQAKEVIATDIDMSALQKLEKGTPKGLSKKLLLLVHNITASFPFNNNTFDGVFNTGTLHLFPRTVLKKIIQETRRVLVPKGIYIFDFATEVLRRSEDGTSIRKSKNEYSKMEAREILTTLLKEQKFKTKFVACRVPPEEVTLGEVTYTFSCNYWLVIARL